MTHQRTMCGVLAVSFALAACASDNKNSTDDVNGTPAGDDSGSTGTGGDTGSGSGSGSDGTGSGSGSGSGSDSGPDYSGTNNGSGMDMDDPEVMVEPTYPTAHPRIYIPANRARLQASLAAHTPQATRFLQQVDRWVGGANIYAFQAWNGALIGALTGDAKYCTRAIAVVDANVASEEALIAAGQKPVVAGNSYLEVGNVIGDLALTYDWCFAQLTATQKTRWLTYANTAVWNVWHPDQAKWGSKTFVWTGWSTNNPSDNYYYSFLRATMLLGLAAKGDDATADQWVTQFRDTKVLGQLVPTFEAQLRGGGSREGTAYGVSMRGLFHLYDLWYATTGEKLSGRTKHARQSLRTAMHQVVPSLDHIVPTGDQPRDHYAEFFDYQRNYLQELIEMYPDDVIAGRAKSLLAGSNVPQMARPEMMAYDFLYDTDDVAAQPLSGMATDYFASGIGQLYSRSSWDKSATWMNLTAGPYTESHAHQDQGALMIWKGGWLAGDNVVNTTSGIIQETSSHSLVRVSSGGTDVKQKVNTTSQMTALHQGNGFLYAATDTAAAYGSGAPVSKMQREIVYLKPDVIVVYDRVATAPGTTQTWQIVAPVAPSINGAVATITSAGHALQVQRLATSSASSVATSLAGKTTSAGSYTGGYRLDENQTGGDVRYLHVLSLDGAATAATASGDSKVTVTMAGGKTAIVEFNRDSTGATLTYNGATTTLAAGLDDIPE